MSSRLPEAFMMRFPDGPNQRIFLITDLKEENPDRRTTVWLLRDGESNPFEGAPLDKHSECERLFLERTELLGHVVKEP